MAYNGMATEYDEGFIDSAYTPASGRMLGQIADMGLFDLNYFTMELQHGGYDDPTVSAMLQMLHARANGDLRTLYAATAITRYKEGYDDEAKLQDNLVTLGVNPVLLPKYLYGAQLAADYDDKADYLDALKQAVRSGAIDPPDMEQLLIKEGMRPAKAKLKAGIEALRNLPKAKRTLATSPTAPVS